MTNEDALSLFRALQKSAIDAQRYSGVMINDRITFATLDCCCLRNFAHLLPFWVEERKRMREQAGVNGEATQRLFSHPIRQENRDTGSEN